jgi:hypothetical protein
VAPSADPNEPTLVEAATKQQASEQVPPEAPSMEQAAPEERQDPNPIQEAPERSAATPSTQEGGLPNAVAQGKGPVVVSRPKSSQRHEEAGAGQ